jgi:hypothetical protein
MEIFIYRFNRKSLTGQLGLAALLTTILILAIGLAIALAISFIFLNEQKISRNFIKTAQAYYTAESGVEDTLYRIIKNKNYQAGNSLDVGGSLATINISDDSGQKIIQVSGDKDNRFRKLRVVLKTSSKDISFHYGIQVGAGGLTMNNDSQVTGSIYSNGPVQGANGAIITGDVWVASISPDLNQQSAVSDSDFIFGRTSPQIDAAQSFTPSSSDQLTKVALYLKKSGSPGNKTVRILTDNSDKPSKTLVGSGAYGTLYTSGISQSEYRWIEVILGTPPNLVAGTKYWVVIDASADSGNYFWWGRDSSDAYSGGTGKYSANWNASSPVWSPAGGDLGFKIWLGQELINTLSGVNVGNDAHANTISICNITRDAYFKTISGSTVGRTQYPGSPDSPMQNMPISDDEINEWKADATAGGVISGDYNLSNGNIASLGPKKINGNLNVSNEADLTITGTVYVAGNINISNDAKIRLGSSYGNLSGVLLTDGLVSISNDSVFYGNGTGTYLLLLSTRSGTAMNIANDVDMAILYASQGAINITDSALKEIVGYSIVLSNGAHVSYESGLASAKFSSGPGGSWVIDSWREE